MLSTNLHQYPSAFSHLPAPNVADRQHQHHHLPSQHIASSPLDTLAHTSQYAALQFHQNHHVLPNGKAIAKPNRLTYATGPIAPRSQRDMLHERSGRSSATSGPVRRRISRACDQCNQLRTKYVTSTQASCTKRLLTRTIRCDGRQSCAHCIGTYSLKVVREGSAAKNLSLVVDASSPGVNATSATPVDLLDGVHAI